MSGMKKVVFGLIGVLALAWVSLPVVVASPLCGAVLGSGWTWQTSETWGTPFTISSVPEVSYRGRSGNGDADVTIMILQHRLLVCEAVTPDGVVGLIPAHTVVLEAVVVDEQTQAGSRVCHQSRMKDNLIGGCRAPAGR